jgi:succinate dehydrogenase/fumarate reductase flavoprotein subunit
MIDQTAIEIWSCNTLIVGSGVAGLNAADNLYNLGQHDIAILTEGFNRGTSRNTGSDKQTYYKLTLAGGASDSVMQMAKTLFEGGSRHGDIALIEAALSARCFYKLVDIGVEFPHNKYGEYVGYKTDHDPRQRATSIGPLTSKVMTEKLEDQVKNKGIQIFDGFLVIGLLTDKDAENAKTLGLMALDLSKLSEPCRGLTVFNCTNIVYATGGPANMYAASVYPESQNGGTGVAFEAGVRGVNLTESQFGIASTKFRWNLSGTYQQVIPRYLSTAPDGSDEREFLYEYFPDSGSLLTAIFLKGYQWPFDPRKIAGYGSSLIDVLVYHETAVKGRKVYLDYTRNPACAEKEGFFDFTVLSDEAYLYLEKSEALFGTPIERLMHMNMPAIELYRAHGIDLETEYLEINVCVQHNNGGLGGNIWWESNLQHFFPVGEVNGSFGVYRPGGSALNATQVGSLRAAQYIAVHYQQDPMPMAAFLEKARKEIVAKLTVARSVADKAGNDSNLRKKIDALRLRMTTAGGHIRILSEIEKALMECRAELKKFPEDIMIRHESELSNVFRYYDMLITQFVYLAAMAEYSRQSGQSRGSYLIYDREGRLPVPGLPEEFRFSLDEGRLFHQVCETVLRVEEDWQCQCDWVPCRPVPREENWFEKVWTEFRQGTIYESR